MGNNNHDISLPRPRKPVGPPPPHSPGFPPPPPKQNIINVNVADNNGALNFAVLSSLQVVNNRITQVESTLENISLTGSSIELGDRAGTAFPGDRGATLERTVYSMMSDLQTNFVTNSKLDSTLMSFARTANVNQSLDTLREDFYRELAEMSGTVSGQIDESIVSALVSSVISSYIHQDQDDYSDILNSINNFNDDFDD